MMTFDEKVKMKTVEAKIDLIEVAKDNGEATDAMLKELHSLKEEFEKMREKAIDDLAEEMLKEWEAPDGSANWGNVR